MAIPASHLEAIVLCIQARCYVAEKIPSTPTTAHNYPALFMVGENLRHSVQSEGASLEESGHGSTQVRRLVHLRRRNLRFARWLR